MSIQSVYMKIQLKGKGAFHYATKPFNIRPCFPHLTCLFSTFLLTNLLQALYGAVDLFMVGRYADSPGVAAVATASQVMQTLTSLIVGLTTGGTIVIAQHYGARQNRDAASAIASTCVVFLLVALLLTIALIAAHDAICHAIASTTRSLICYQAISFLLRLWHCFHCWI